MKEKQIREELEEIYKDCLEQEKIGGLSELGAGMGNTCIQVLRKKRDPFKFTKDNTLKVVADKPHEILFSNKLVELYFNDKNEDITLRIEGERFKLNFKYENYQEEKDWIIEQLV